MQKTLLSFSALALLSVFNPASAQMMCGPGQQAQASAAGGMMCGAPMNAAASKAEGETQKPQAGGMCPCCRNMAMMRRGGSGGSMPDMPK